MVKGTITNETGSNAPSPRKFVQTFLLAQQPSGYYVRNDILRYLAEEDGSAKTTSAVHAQSEAAPAPAVEKAKEAAPAPAVVETAKPAEPEQPAQQQSAPATPVPEAAQEETKPQEPEQPKETPAPVVATPAPAAAEEQPKETPAPAAAAASKESRAPAAAPVAVSHDTGKTSPATKTARPPQAGRGKGKDDKTRAPASPAAAPAAEKPAAAPAVAKAEPAPVDNSWAALARRKADVPVTPLAAQARVPKVVKKPTEESAAAPGAGAAAPGKEETAPAAGEQSAPADKKVVSDPNSIYVSNLPFAAKQNQVTDAFKGFGKIVSVSMQSDKGYAFIEYDTIEAAHSAIKLATENPISMDGRVLRVEERKTKRGGGAGRKVPGGRPSGSGSDRIPRPRPEGKERATGSPRPNGTGSERRDRRGDKRAPGTGSPAVSRPAAGGASSGGPARRPAPAAAAAPTTSAPAAGGAAAGKK